MGGRRVLVIGGAFSGLCVARDLKSHYRTTIVDAKEFFEYTPGVLRAYVKPKHLDALTFTLKTVIEDYMGCMFIWGEVKALDGPNRTATIKPMFVNQEELVEFDFCVICSGCNFGLLHPYGESPWFPVVHEIGRANSAWPHIDERFLEGRRRRILEEYAKIQDLERREATILVVGAGFIGVEWVTELKYFFPKLNLTIIDMLPNILGPLPESAQRYCQRYLDKHGINTFVSTKYDPKGEDFWNKIELPNKADETYFCLGVKSSNYFMPPETLSEKGEFPGGAGWILIDKTLAVVTKENKVWSEEGGYPRIFAVGDCNTSGIYERDAKGGFVLDKAGKKKLAIPFIPKISYPGEEEAVIAVRNIEKIDSLFFDNEPLGCFNQKLKIHNMHWPWGAGMFATSLGKHDACFVLGANWEKLSGHLLIWGRLSAIQKEVIEMSKVDECRMGYIGRIIWHFVHHTPVHFFGGGPMFGY